MEIRLQSLVYKMIQPIVDKLNKLSDKKRELIFIISGVLIFLISIIYDFGRGSRFFTLSYAIVYSPICILLLLMSVILVKEFQHKKFDILILIPIVLLGFGALISGFVNDVDHLSTAIFILFIFPFLLLCWSNVDFSKIMLLLCKSARIVYWIFLIVSIIFFPIEGRKYQGMFYNQNGISFFLILVFCCLLIELLNKKLRVPTAIFDIMALSSVVALLYYSNSRTGQYLLIVLSLAFVIFVLTQGKETIIFIAKNRLLPVLISVVIAIPFTLLIFQFSNDLQAKMFGRPLPEIAYTEIRAYILEKNNVDIELIDEEELADKTYAEKLEDIRLTNEAKMKVNGRSLTRYSSGRTDIWKAWLKEVNLIGHSNSDTFLLRVEGTTMKRGSAHNTAIGYAYKFGAVSGIAFLCINIISGIKSLYFAFRKNKGIYDIAPLLISISFVFIALLAQVDSLGYMISLYYVFVQIPLITKGAHKIECTDC